MAVELETPFDQAPVIPDLTPTIDANDPLGLAGRRRVDLVESFELLLSPLHRPSWQDRIRGRAPEHHVVIDGTLIEMMHARSNRAPSLVISRGRDVVSFDRVGEAAIKRNVLAAQPLTGVLSRASSREVDLGEADAVVGIIRDHDSEDPLVIAENLKRIGILMRLSQEEEEQLEEERLRLLTASDEGHEIDLILGEEAPLR